MLLGIFGASLLGNILANKRINRANVLFVRAGYENKKTDFWCHLILWLILKYKSIIKMKPD